MELEYHRSPSVYWPVSSVHQAVYHADFSSLTFYFGRLFLMSSLKYRHPSRWKWQHFVVLQWHTPKSRLAELCYSVCFVLRDAVFIGGLFFYKKIKGKAHFDLLWAHCRGRRGVSLSSTVKACGVSSRQTPAHLREISPQINPSRVHSGCVIDVIPGLTCDQLSLIQLRALRFPSTSNQLTANQKAGAGVSPGLAPLMLKQHDGAFISFERIIIVC